MSARPSIRVLLLGLGVPLVLLVGLTLAPPWTHLRFLGISGAIWCLFACAPITSLCLLACNRQQQDETP